MQTNKTNEISFYGVIHVSKTLTMKKFLDEFCQDCETDEEAERRWDALCKKVNPKNEKYAEFKCEDLDGGDVSAELDDELDPAIEEVVEEVVAEEKEKTQ